MRDPVADIAARQAIADGLSRYCRGIDRMDEDALLAVFHPDATIAYPSYSGDRAGLVERMWEVHGGLDMHSHQVTNAIIELDDEARSAAVEAYVTATWWRTDAADAETGVLHSIHARYLDRWSDGPTGWGIDHRRCVVDIRSEMRVTGSVGDGRRDRHDASYALMGAGSGEPR